MSDPNASLAPNEVAPELTALAGNVQLLRRARGLTMRELATRSGVTQGFISQVESGRSVPSVVTLLRMADALGVGLPAIVDGPNHETVVNFVDHRQPEVFNIADDERASARVLTHGQTTMEAFEMTIESNASLGGHLTHSGTDFIFMMAGQLTVDLEGHGTHVLSPGDSLSHPGEVPHKWSVTSGQPAEFLCVVVRGPQAPTGTRPH